MRTPQDILGEIWYVIGLFVSIPVMFAVMAGLGLAHSASNGGGSPWIFLILIPGCLLFFKSTKWMMLGIEHITGFKFAVFGWYGISMMFLIGGALSVIIIPTGLLLLALQYFRAKKAANSLSCETVPRNGKPA